MARGHPSSDDPRPATLIIEEPAPSSVARRQYQPGETIGNRYQLERLIGRGGMGEVWTAHNTSLGVRQALKLIRAEADSRENTDRLLHEARAAARLPDPAIVRVFDFGKTAWGDPFIVMEHLEGEDLSQVIQRKERLDPIKAVRTLLPVIRALGAAHTHGIVHRDLKPENIYLARLPDGRVMPKLLDFGIAKLQSSPSLRLTSVGSVVGSPLYMSPEQARGEEVDERTDIWAMCVVLYEAISGRLPFYGSSRSEVLRAAAEKEPDDLAQAGVVDAELWRIILAGLSKTRDTRWSSMRVLGRALAQWLLAQRATEDITGASIEMGWLREHPQSFFSASLAPASSRRHARTTQTRVVLDVKRFVLDARSLGLQGWQAGRKRWQGLAKRQQRGVLAGVGGTIVLALIGLGLLRSGSPTEVPEALAPASSLAAPTSPGSAVPNEPVVPALAPTAPDREAAPATAPPSTLVPDGPRAPDGASEGPLDPAAARPTAPAPAPPVVPPPNRRGAKPGRSPVKAAAQERRAKLLNPFD